MPHCGTFQLAMTLLLLVLSSCWPICFGVLAASLPVEPDETDAEVTFMTKHAFELLIAAIAVTFCFFFHVHMSCRHPEERQRAPLAHTVFFTLLPFAGVVMSLYGLRSYVDRRTLDQSMERITSLIWLHKYTEAAVPLLATTFVVPCAWIAFKVERHLTLKRVLSTTAYCALLHIVGWVLLIIQLLVARNFHETREEHHATPTNGTGLGPPARRSAGPEPDTEIDFSLVFFWQIPAALMCSTFPALIMACVHALERCFSQSSVGVAENETGTNTINTAESLTETIHAADAPRATYIPVWSVVRKVACILLNVFLALVEEDIISTKWIVRITLEGALILWNCFEVRQSVHKYNQRLLLQAARTNYRTEDEKTLKHWCWSAMAFLLCASLGEAGMIFFQNPIVERLAKDKHFATIKFLVFSLALAPAMAANIQVQLGYDGFLDARDKRQQQKEQELRRMEEEEEEEEEEEGAHNGTRVQEVDASRDNHVGALEHHNIMKTDDSGYISSSYPSTPASDQSQSGTGGTTPTPTRPAMSHSHHHKAFARQYSGHKDETHAGSRWPIDSATGHVQQREADGYLPNMVSDF